MNARADMLLKYTLDGLFHTHKRGLILKKHAHDILDFLKKWFPNLFIEYHVSENFIHIYDFTLAYVYL